MRSILFVSALLGVVTGLLSQVAPVFAQNPDYDFYDEFGRWSYELLVRDRISPDQVLKQYGEKLRADGISDKEIERRVNLILNQRPKLEADWWNRSLTADKPDFNTAPNALLVEVVKDLKPGTALDVGMGEGRNAIYLAQQGWAVTGFDIAGRAMELARNRATQIGKRIDTAVSTTKDWKYEENKWDLIVYSWVGLPMDRSADVIRSLRANGIIVFEGRGEWAPEEGVRKAFSALRTIRYEKRRRSDADFFRGAEVPVVQFVAQKPE
jgi:SAM-dependent methyltransferase